MYRNQVQIAHGERFLSNASVVLAESLDFDEVLAKIGALVLPALADWYTLDVVEGRELQRVAAQHSDPAKRGLLDDLGRHAPLDLDSPQPQMRALRSLAPLLVPEITPEFMLAGVRDQRHLRMVEALEPRSLMALPLIARGRALGVLTLVRAQLGASYGAGELAVAEELARRVAMALDNARLHSDLAEAVRLKDERERFLKTIFRQVPGAIWAVDRGLRYTYVAGNLLNAPGLDGRAIVGTTVEDFVANRLQAGAFAVEGHRLAVAGERQSFPFLYGGRSYEVLLEPLRNANREVVGAVGAAFDVTKRRAAEEQLARSEARLSEAQRVAHVGSFEWDVRSNVVTWTDELHRIYGLEPGQFAGTFEAFLSRVHPADLEYTQGVVTGAFRAAKPFVYDHRVVRPDGSTRVLHTVGDVIKDERDNPIRMVGTCWDVTELNEATSARERTLSLLQATVEATGDGILVVDRAGQVTLINRRMQQLWGLGKPGDGLGGEDAILDIMLAQVEDPEDFRAGVAALRAQPDMEGVQVVQLRDGRAFERYSRPQRIGDAIVGRVWSYRDVSEREQLLRRALFLADATRLLASLDVERALEAVAHLIVPYFADGCAIDLFGDGAPRRLLALSRDPRRPIAPQVHPSVLAGHSTLFRVDAMPYLGVPLIVDSGVVGAMTLAAPAYRKYTQIDLDLAEELGRRAALAFENALLFRRAQEALRARDEFLSIAAHEIRTPITSLHLAVQMLHRGQVPLKDQSAIIEMIEREDRRLAQFVDELLDLSRVRSGTLRFEFEPVELGDVVRDVTARLAPELARTKSSLSMTVQGSVRGEWDRLRVEQIVSNLVANAVKFGAGRPVQVSVSEHDGIAVLEVRDQGIGISRDMQSRIFEPFERAVSARHYGGLGLGLFIAKTLVEGLGGHILVQSATGEGSTFTVELPRARAH